MSNPLKGLGTLTIAGFIGYIWLTSGNTPRQQMQAPSMQSAAAKSEPKLPALPIAEDLIAIDDAGDHDKARPRRRA